ncbi:MAG: prepilin-type N-terminal cleavage/methylation domain-containing protein [Verrucomicrobia bacterium]|nr:prepilin-type N-terminal cleavage/methylation domain-containing protein [Verrucomicrobiota bacterium]
MMDCWRTGGGTAPDAGTSHLRNSASPVPAVKGPGGRSRGGFTLIEIILVVLIILVASAIAVPSFVRSYRGARLRTSVRTVVMASRYARSTAVLKQKQAAILFDIKAQSLEVVSVEPEAGSADRDMFRDLRGQGPGGDSEEEGKMLVTRELKRPLEDGIKITEFDAGDTEQVLDGIYWISFYPNGVCDDFALRLSDDKGSSVRIEVDHLSGSAKVEYEN